MSQQNHEFEFHSLSFHFEEVVSLFVEKLNSESQLVREQVELPFHIADKGELGFSYLSRGVPKMARS